MKRRINWLGVLRRQRSGLGRFVLAFFAVATVTMTGAPCFAMAAGAQVSPAMHHEGMHAGMTMVAHDHSHFAHASEHGASSPHGSPDPSHQCPHCPLAAPMSGYTTTSGSHAVCAGLGGASDQAQAGVTMPPFKHIAAAPQFEPAASAVLRPPGTARAFVPPALARPSVPLNVRHCVFLI